MTLKYRFLLAVLFTLLAIYSQLVFGQTTNLPKKVQIGAAMLPAIAHPVKANDCQGSAAGTIILSGTCTACDACVPLNDRREDVYPGNYTSLSASYSTCSTPDKVLTTSTTAVSSLNGWIRTVTVASPKQYFR